MKDPALCVCRETARIMKTSVKLPRLGLHDQIYFELKSRLKAVKVLDGDRLDNVRINGDNAGKSSGILGVRLCAQLSKFVNVKLLAVGLVHGSGF